MNRADANGTEAIHPLAARLDGVSPQGYLEAMLDDHRRVDAVVRAALPDIAKLASAVAETLRVGGRVVLVGAGTSGRLAALEAAECPPTFGTDPAQFVALVAGGPAAMLRAVEGAEDDATAGERDVDVLAVGAGDLIIGVSASGRTPYVAGALATARERGARVAVIVCNAAAPLSGMADLVVTLPTGPEFVAGSTRLKAASAQKLALNMTTTAAMRSLGNVRSGRMTGLRATNSKLRKRAASTVRDLAGISSDEAALLLERAGGDVALALQLAGAYKATATSARPPSAIPAVLRTLTPDDASAVTTLAAEPSVVASTAPFADLGGEELFRRWLGRPGLMLGAWVGGSLVGAALVERRAALLREHVADVTYIAVAPEARGSGVADQLLAAVVTWAREELLTRLELRVWPANIAAIRLYERHGFEVEGRLRAHARVNGQWIDALLMARVDIPPDSCDATDSERR